MNYECSECGDEITEKQNKLNIGLCDECVELIKINENNMIELRLPLKQIMVNQPFGVNYLDFYQQWGLKGHNGVDFQAVDGFNVYAAHSGIVSYAQTYDDGGKKPMKHVEILSQEEDFKTIYLHLAEYNVSEDYKVHAGQLIGKCDNTGKYTTGNHLHFGLKPVSAVGWTIQKNNGYNGAIDPTPYFKYSQDGTPIKNKDCYQSNAYHRYFRRERNYKNEVRVLGELLRYLKRMPTVEQINACVYGGWDREAVENIALRYNWAFLKKDEYINGKRPFQD